MPRLKVTARGQVTFRKEVLQHLGVRPGEGLELDLLPGARAVLRGARAEGSIGDFIDLLASKTTRRATIEEMNDAAAKGWAGKA